MDTTTKEVHARHYHVLPEYGTEMLGSIACDDRMLQLDPEQKGHILPPENGAIDCVYAECPASMEMTPFIVPYICATCLEVCCQPPDQDPKVPTTEA
ncbi:hypothetical protein HJFPF1_10814 [Paramyrothecium foliicola]|nr:hypothetical protein HJFPF1_10814 [Paramyrothecium foliicola]